jgi:hypothetical protein
MARNVNRLASAKIAYDPHRAGTYRPRISPAHLRRLWLEKQCTGKTMTTLVAQALDDYFRGR